MPRVKAGHDFFEGFQSSVGNMIVMAGCGSSMSRGPQRAVNLTRHGRRLSLRTRWWMGPPSPLRLRRDKSASAALPDKDMFGGTPDMARETHALPVHLPSPHPPLPRRRAVATLQRFSTR
jgi:hypothetical protein